MFWKDLLGGVSLNLQVSDIISKCINLILDPSFFLSSNILTFLALQKN